MKRLALILVLSLIGLLAPAAPAAAWGFRGTCETSTYRTETPIGWRTRVKIREVTVCRDTAGHVIRVIVTVRRFTLPRT